MASKISHLMRGFHRAIQGVVMPRPRREKAEKRCLGVEPLEARCLLSEMTITGTAGPQPGTNSVMTVTVTTGSTGTIYLLSMISAVGDFNGDGKTDIAYNNQNGTDAERKKIAILANDGYGSYAPVGGISLPYMVRSLMAADVNGDGKMDLICSDGKSVLSNTEAKTVSTFLGNGDGTFAARIDTSLDNSLHSLQTILTGDFNGDGKIDLAFANTTGNTLSVMLGNGDGTFAARKNSTTEGNPCNAIAADFNHDGKMDLAYTTQIDNQVHILPGNGDGTFGTQAVYATAKNPGYLTVGDFRGVGETDLAVTYRLGSETQYQCSILLNNGDGTFAPGIYTPLGGYAETTLAGDFNGDGKTDLVITEGAMTNVMLSDGDGTFTPLVKYNSRYGPYALVAADFNGDGKADLVEVNTGTNSVSWLRDSTSNDASINPLENIVSVSVADHLNSGAIVANLPGESSGAVSYALVSSAGSNDNALFCLNGFQLKTAVSFDYSYKNSYSIRLQVIATSRQVFENEFTVNIIEGKDAPVLDNSGDIYLRPINKELSANHNQGTLVKDIVGTHLTNTDANALEGIAITNTYDALGTWQFSLDGGTTWTDMGSVSATSSRLLAADDLTRIRLLPRSDAASQIVWAIYFRGWDQTVGVNGGTADTSTNGGSTAFSSNERYASIAVNSITVATYSDGNFRMDGCTDCKFDTSYYFGQAGDIAITGDWNGDGETEIGVFRNGTFILDTNDNGYVDSYDATVAFGTKGDKPVIGDWNGDGTSEVGVFRNGRFYMDSDGSRSWAASDATFLFGTTGDQPVGGDWNNDGTSEVGVFRNGRFYLDSDGSRSWAASDATFLFGTSGDQPIVGDWNGDGVSDVGVYRCTTFFMDQNGSRSWDADDISIVYGSGGQAVISQARYYPELIGVYAGNTFYIDTNDNHRWDGDQHKVSYCFGGVIADAGEAVVGDWMGVGSDKVGVFHDGLFDLDGVNSVGNPITFGTAGDIPLAGDWNGDGTDEIGVFRKGKFYLDLNGSRSWNTGDVSFTFGTTGDLPVAGDWNGDGKSEIGVYRKGTFYLDSNGSRSWNNGDTSFAFGTDGSTPLAGDWDGDGRDEVGVFYKGTVYRDKNGNQSWDKEDDYMTLSKASGVQALVGAWHY